MPSGTLDGTNVPKKKVFSSIAKTLEFIIDVIAEPVFSDGTTTYSSKIDSKSSVLIPGTQLSPITSYRIPSG